MNVKNADAVTPINPPNFPPVVSPSPAATRDADVRVVASRLSCTRRFHWEEYGIEATLSGVLMVGACSFAALLNHPASLLVSAVPDHSARRAIVGLAMGMTVLALVHSPFGKRSGAHFNPAVTLTFFRLRKIESHDAALYIVSQFIGGMLGLMLAALAMHGALAHTAVRYAVTEGSNGPMIAFAAEMAISFVLMTVVLFTTNSVRLMRRTPLFIATLIALCIAFETPYSGMSMNPARSSASALAAHYFTGLWIYFTAPLLGMLVAAELHLRLRRSLPKCAKLHHANNEPCIFRCGYKQPVSKASTASGLDNSGLQSTLT